LAGFREKDLAEQLPVLWLGSETAAKHVKMARKQIICNSKGYDIARY